MMSQKGQSFSVLEDKCELTDGIWYATMKVKNNKTQHETVGYAQQPKLMETKDGGTKLDEFARTKAMSKAERNAWRKQIPELQIKAFIDVITQKNPEGTKKLKTKQANAVEYCTCTPDAQIPSEDLIKEGQTSFPETVGCLHCKHCQRIISKIVTRAILQKRTT